MIKTSKIQFGKTIYDYSNILLGGFDNIITIIQLNPDFVSMDVDLDDFATKKLVYDDQYYQAKTVQVQLGTPAADATIKYITSLSEQNLYDLNLMAYSGFDHVVKFLIDNSINSTNNQDLGLKTYKFDTTLNTDESLSVIVKNKGYVFSTGAIATRIEETFYRLTEAGDIRETEASEPRIIE